MIKIEGKIILLGDLHFGIKRFSIDVLRNQLKLFNNQIIPYMKENNIRHIIQLGDLLDQRTTADINFIKVLSEEFFDVLIDNDITLHSLIGNHDIYWRETRSVSLVDFFSNLYDNFILYKNRTTIDINGYKTYIVPWIVKGEDLTYDEIKDKHTILGHFEIRHFNLVKGHMDETSKLTTEFFTKNTDVKNVLSGHYHIKDTRGLVKYLGTPWQLNWGDYDEEKGFYIWDEDNNLEFIENISTKKYIKVKYNDVKHTNKNIEVQGLKNYKLVLSDEEYDDILPILKEHEIKFFINESKDRHFDEILYKMKQSEVKSTIINNQELSEIVGTNYVYEELETLDTRNLIIETIKKENDKVLPKLLNLLNEIESTKINEGL